MGVKGQSDLVSLFSRKGCTVISFSFFFTIHRVGLEVLAIDSVRVFRHASNCVRLYLHTAVL